MFNLRSKVDSASKVNTVDLQKLFEQKNQEVTSNIIIVFVRNKPKKSLKKMCLQFIFPSFEFEKTIANSQTN